MCQFLPCLSLLLLLATLGCVSPKMTSQISRPGGVNGVEERLWSPAALAEALAARPDRELRIATDCRSESGFVSAVIYGHGVAIWDRRAQTRLEQREIPRLLEAFRTHDFAGMRELYGGAADPAPHTEVGLELICRVEVARGKLVKQVVQLSEGRQHAPLFALAEEILDAVAAERGRGVGAASLAEGLAKLSAGELAPEVLELRFLEQAERPGEGGESRQWTLRGGQLADGSGEPSAERFLESEEIATLARELVAAEVESWPGNLFSDTYIDFSVAVLSHEKNVQARTFAGMDDSTHGEHQRRFERMLTQLRALSPLERR